MANAVPILSENPGTSKRKRSHVHPPETQEQDGGGGGGEASTELRKKKITDQRGAWANLDLILSLQMKDTPIQRSLLYTKKLHLCFSLSVSLNPIRVVFCAGRSGLLLITLA